MTDKELHKLGRRELLQLMLAQGREAEKAKEELAEALQKLSQLEAGYERLKRRLDDKDAQIHKLRSALQAMQEAPGGFRVNPASAVPQIPAPDDYYAPPLQQEPPPSTLVEDGVNQQAYAGQPDPPPAQAKPGAQGNPHHGRQAAAEDEFMQPAYDEVPQETETSSQDLPLQGQEEKPRPTHIGPSQTQGPGGVQPLQAIKIVNGKVVSQSQVVRTRYH